MPVNSSSKCSTSYGPRAFGGPAVLCVKPFHYFMQGVDIRFWVPNTNFREVGYPMQTFGKWTLLYTCCTKSLFAESKLNFSFCLEICFCVEVYFTLNYLESFDFKLLFLYTFSMHIKFAEVPLLAHLRMTVALFWLIYDLPQCLWL